MSNILKGFIFGAVAMLMTPALAIPSGNAAPEAPETGLIEQYFRLSYQDAEEAIAAALSERGAGAKIAAAITRRDNDYIFSYSHPISVEIRGLKFDEKTRRFTANLLPISEGKVLSATAISGSYDEMMEVPVLKRSIKAGDVIKAEDIELRDYTAARTRDSTITDIASLIGKSPVRVITEGRPIREHELALPIEVKKNDLVKMYYRSGPMTITTNGQAQDDGSKGTMIMVRNLSSKKLVQAQVVDATTVVITDQNTLTSRLNGDDHDTN